MVNPKPMWRGNSRWVGRPDCPHHGVQIAALDDDARRRLFLRRHGKGVSRFLGDLLDGKQADGLDQTGLSQKGGSVISNLKIRRIQDESPEMGQANKVSTGEASAYLVFDVLTGASPANLEKCDPDKTVAVVSSSKVPTGSMVRDTSAAFPEWAS